MASLIELAGRTFALVHDGPGRPQAADGGLILPPGRVALLHELGDALFYRHGQNSWSPCGWRRLSEPPLRIANPQRRVTADDTVWDDPGRHHSSAVAALDAGDGNILLLGSLGLGTPRLSADRDTLAGWYEHGAGPWFAAYGPEQQVFAAYTRELAARLGSSARRAGNVWCSWYAYYETITEEQLATDIQDLRGLPFDVVQVDDGWEQLVGDWEPNEKFPSGMKALADRISDAGMTPGLWLAPFIALPTSRFARENPELLLRDADGEPVIAGNNWGTGYYALDLSRPAAREHVAALIHRVVHEWGFRYLKLDFINAGAVPGVRLDGAEREQTYRDALTLIRQVAGDDVYLLGSGASCCRRSASWTGCAAARTSRRCGRTTPATTRPTRWPAMPWSTRCTGSGGSRSWRSTRTSCTSAAASTCSPTSSWPGCATSPTSAGSGRCPTRPPGSRRPSARTCRAI